VDTGLRTKADEEHLPRDFQLSPLARGTESEASRGCIVPAVLSKMALTDFMAGDCTRASPSKVTLIKYGARSINCVCEFSRTLLGRRDVHSAFWYKMRLIANPQGVFV
jgi:hypothetical protein